MRRVMMRVGTACGLALMIAVSSEGQAPGVWLQWRGPFNNGMALGDAPLRWDDRTNVRWKIEIPGRGHSTPVVSGNRLFLTTAVPTGIRSPYRGRGADGGAEHRFEVLAVDRTSGKVAWQRTATVATPHEGYHGTYGSFASNSPVTDGKRVFAFFGSRGLYAYDLNGSPLWSKDFGVKMRMDAAWGEGTPLTLHDNRLLLHFDHLDLGFLVMLDPATGKEIWRIKRTEGYNWAAPVVAVHGGQRQIIVSGQTVRGYDFETGANLWEAAGLGENSVPQPVQHGDMVYAMSGHNVRMLLAIRLGRKGNLTGTDGVAWSTPRGVSYTPSPLVHENRLYVLTDSGLLSNFNATTGVPIYLQRRLSQPYNFKASPVGANGKLYLATEEGDIVVVRMGDAFEVLATNTMEGQSFIASPVIVDGDIYLRSRTHLFRIGDR